jgi:Kef-type K+ transport system membrane component KefB
VSAPDAPGAAGSELAWSYVLPTTWPQANLVGIFGLLLAFGVLGGLLAARARWLPTITGFMAVGLVAGPSGLGLLGPKALASTTALVEIALGLILFKLGVTLHPVKALRNRRLVVTALAEGLLTFGVILALMLWIDAPPVVAVLAAAIAVSSSPAVLIHVAEELHAKGPVLEHAQSLVAANNVLSFILFSLALPVALLGQRFTLATALALPAYQLLGAVVVAVVVAWLVTSVARLTRADELHFRFALVVGAVMLTLGLAQALKVSSLFAGLALGIACRWLQGRTRLTRVEFGGGGDVFFVILFVLAGANLHLQELWLYAPLALAFVAARTLAKLGAVAGCGLAFGAGARPALASGLLLVPMAGLAIGLVQTTTQLMPEVGTRVAAIVLAAVAIFETVGPPIAAFAMRFVGEAGRAARPTEEVPAVPAPLAPAAPATQPGASPSGTGPLPEAPGR